MENEYSQENFCGSSFFAKVKRLQLNKNHENCMYVKVLHLNVFAGYFVLTKF